LPVLWRARDRGRRGIRRRRGGGRLYDLRRIGAGAARTGAVGTGDGDADRRADVGGGQRVALAAGAVDVGAAAAAAVAAPPLVGEADRRRPAPAAGVGAQRLPVLGRARDRGRRGVRRRRGGGRLYDLRRIGAGAARTGAVGTGDGDADRRADVGGGQRVALAAGAVDVGA